MFFHSWAGIGHVMLSSVVVFAIIVVLLRIVGQQALAKMSGFDVVFTVTLGSVIGTVVITRDVPIAEAVAALVTLLGMQEVTRFFQSRSLRVHHAVRQPPRVVLWDGELLEDRLRASSVSADEIRAAVRKAGLRSLSDAQIVVLENDGDWSVVAKREGESDESAYYGLAIPGRPDNAPGEGSDRGRPVGPDRLP
jgi:uncharacterized membrane protein YcaP (DUF421 family)